MVTPTIKISLHFVSKGVLSLSQYLTCSLLLNAAQSFCPSVHPIGQLSLVRSSLSMPQPKLSLSPTRRLGLGVDNKSFSSAHINIVLMRWLDRTNLEMTLCRTAWRVWWSLAPLELWIHLTWDCLHCLRLPLSWLSLLYGDRQLQVDSCSNQSTSWDHNKSQRAWLIVTCWTENERGWRR